MTRRALTLDAAVALALSALAAGFVLWLIHAGGQEVARHNVYFGADTDRVLANLVDRNSRFDRLSVHPLFGHVGIAFRLLTTEGGDLAAQLAVYHALVGFLVAGLTYAAVRVWGGDPWSAAGATLFTIGGSAFVYWVAVPETHILASIGLLLALCLSRLAPRSMFGRVSVSVATFVLTIAIVLTDVALWAFGHLWPRSRSDRGAIRRVVDLPLVAVSGLAGVGALALLNVAQEYGLRNGSAPRLFHHLLGERKFVAAFAAPPLDGAGALSLFGRDSVLFVPSGLAMAAALGWALARSPAERRFVALFPLAGFALHSVYDRAHSFLFTPNYAACCAVAIAVALSSTRFSRTGAIGMAVVGVAAAAVNVDGYLAKRRSIVAQTDPPSRYAALRRPHPLPRTPDPFPADPPLGPER